jgi:hypothetical protein
MILWAIVHLAAEESHLEFGDQNMKGVLVSLARKKTEIFDSGPNSWHSTCHIWPLTPMCQIKSCGKGQRK